MNNLTFESSQRLWKMWSVRIQGLWASACAAYLVMPDAQQQALVALAGLEGPGAMAAVAFSAQVSMAISAATIAARATRQPSLPEA